jgi:(E)-4-hydroxy-3-methyl-but-2-enyl pyrophosphate reductase
MAMNSAEKGGNIVTLGPLIHNPQMVEKLHNRGIEVVEKHAEIGNRTAIIRSYGIPFQERELLKEAGHILLDATCPYVAKTQDLARELSDAGYPVLILGNKEHPEVIALQSYVKGPAYVISDVSELHLDGGAKIGVISQTTQDVEKLQNLVSALPALFKEIRVYNTICNATSIRQQSTRKLAQDSDLMLVIGGKNSSNTRMLAKISGEYAETHLLEIPQEIDNKWFCGKKKIGLTAGASTPDWLIIEVYNHIIEAVGNRTRAYHVEDIPVYKEEDHVSK